MASPNSALLLGVGTAAVQRARLEAAAARLEARKALALADERYEECATLRDALVPLREAAGADNAGLPPLGEAALLAALGGAASGGSPLHPRLRCATWRVDNRYFSAEVELLSLPLDAPWPEASAAVLEEAGPAGTDKRRCQAVVAVVDGGTDPATLDALGAAAEAADPELLLLCEVAAERAAPPDAAAAAAARGERLAKLGADPEAEPEAEPEEPDADAEGPLWEWSVQHGFEHVVLPWHVAVGAGLGAALGESEELSVEHGLGRVVEALRNTVWGSLDMKPRSPSGAAAGSGGGSGPGARAGNSALIVNFLPEAEAVEGAGAPITRANICAALGLGSASPAVATWRVHNRYFSADVGLRFLDACSEPAAALDAARVALGERTASGAARCGAVVLLASRAMGTSPEGSALLAEWAAAVASASAGVPELLTLCTNGPPPREEAEGGGQSQQEAQSSGWYQEAVMWCSEHGYELVRPAQTPQVRCPPPPAGHAAAAERVLCWLCRRKVRPPKKSARGRGRGRTSRG